MVSKRQREQRNNATAALVQYHKKRKTEREQACFQLSNDSSDGELSTDDTENDNEAKWFWNDSANETESDSEEEGNSDQDLDLDLDLDLDQPDLDPDMNKDKPESNNKQPGIDKEAPKMMSLRWNKEAENNLRGGYGKGSRSTTQRQQRAAKALEQENSHTPHIGALFQRQLEMKPSSSSSQKLAEPSLSEPVDSITPVSLLSQLPRGDLISKSKVQLRKEQRSQALKDITRLLELVTEQEKKYGERLSVQSNFYRRHLMVQQFLTIQEITQPSQPRKVLSLNIARCFGRSHGTAKNIVRWENSWVNNREVPQRKERNDYESWMDDESLRESMRDFARKLGDRMYYSDLVCYGLMSYTK